MYVWPFYNITRERVKCKMNNIYFLARKSKLIIQVKSYFGLYWHCVSQTFSQWQTLNKLFSKRNTNFWWKLAFFGIFWSWEKTKKRNYGSQCLFFVQTGLFTEESYVSYTNVCRSFTKSLLYIPIHSMWATLS